MTNGMKEYKHKEEVKGPSPGGLQALKTGRRGPWVNEILWKSGQEVNDQVSDAVSRSR